MKTLIATLFIAALCVSAGAQNLTNTVDLSPPVARNVTVTLSSNQVEVLRREWRVWQQATQQTNVNFNAWFGDIVNQTMTNRAVQSRNALLSRLNRIAAGQMDVVKIERAIRALYDTTPVE